MVFRSKKEVVLNSRTQELGFIEMEIESINYNPISGYNAVCFYKSIDVGIERLNVSFTKNEVDLIEEKEPINGLTFNQKFDNLITKVAFLEFSKWNVYGLTESDWELKHL